jgi:hypothetical protein
MSNIVRILTMGVTSASLTVVAAWGLLAGPAMAAPTDNLLNNVSYYTVTNPTTHPGSFCRYATPSTVSLSTGGTDSQARNPAGNGPAGLSIDGATTYTDDGFYAPAGTLGDLNGYTIHASGGFGDNLWFDTNTADDTSTNGSFFQWDGGSPDCLTTLGGDDYGLGPASSSTGGDQSNVTVNDSSSFFMTSRPGGCGTYGYSVTLAQLKAGACPGISSSTPVAVWIGITAPSGGSLSATIDSAHLSTSGH